MPRHPSTSPALDDVTASVYSALAERAQRAGSEVFPFHVGDTYLAPAPACRMENLREADYPGMHRYTSPQGWPPLIEALTTQAERRTSLPHSPDQILVGAGATGALGAVVGALADPGEEILILAPFWPLIGGIVKSFRAVPVPVPCLAGEVDDPNSLRRVLEAHLSPRSVAVYLNTPSNPAGRVLPPEWVETIVDFARRFDLWILSDEVYEDLVYVGEHLPTRRLAPERTISAHSFSKSYGLTGTRCGWLVGPAPALEAARKISTNTVYSTPTPSQISGLKALEGHADAWLTDARERYRQAGAAAARRLGIAAPEGSTFLFLDIREALGADGLGAFLERAADRGLLVAPGPSFGPYPTHIRLCFTAAPADVVERGVEVLAQLLSAADLDNGRPQP